MSENLVECSGCKKVYNSDKQSGACPHCLLTGGQADDTYIPCSRCTVVYNRHTQSCDCPHVGLEFSTQQERLPLPGIVLIECHICHRKYVSGSRHVCTGGVEGFGQPDGTEVERLPLPAIAPLDRLDVVWIEAKQEHVTQPLQYTQDEATLLASKMKRLNRSMRAESKLHAKQRRWVRIQDKMRSMHTKDINAATAELEREDMSAEMRLRGLEAFEDDI